jgi:hypothetical protein
VIASDSRISNGESVADSRTSNGESVASFATDNPLLIVSNGLSVVDCKQRNFRCCEISNG